jgi:hypothetical protein
MRFSCFADAAAADPDAEKRIAADDTCSRVKSGKSERF